MVLGWNSNTGDLKKQMWRLRLYSSVQNTGSDDNLNYLQVYIVQLTQSIRTHFVNRTFARPLYTFIWILLIRFRVLFFHYSGDITLLMLCVYAVNVNEPIKSLDYFNATEIPHTFIRSRAYTSTYATHVFCVQWVCMTLYSPFSLWSVHMSRWFLIWSVKELDAKHRYFGL